ncbi:MAG: enoyl-ACP reductase [Verrucomicrobia bacterium]|nr:enoyl-ACP reductase [Verrucomicrobiota bacterium]
MSNLALAGKVGLVFGVANKRSIAWGIAKAWADAGAKLIFNYQGERLKENVEELAATFGADTPVAPCDVSRDEDIAKFFDFVKTKTPRVDLLLHSVAFAPKEALEGNFVDTSREAFRVAHDISAYSLVAVSRAAAPLMTAGGSIVTMSYYGAEKVVPHYNVMGVAAISAGPVNTLAARGISGFSAMLSHYEAHAPLKRNITLEELGATGVFLASDGAAGITGQTMYADAGYCVMGM